MSSSHRSRLRSEGVPERTTTTTTTTTKSWAEVNTPALDTVIQENATASLGAPLFQFLANFQFNLRTRPGYAFSNGFLLVLVLGILVYFCLWVMSWIDYGLKSSADRNASNACNGTVGQSDSAELDVETHRASTAMVESDPVTQRVRLYHNPECTMLNRLRMNMMHEPYATVRVAIVWILLVALMFSVLFYLRARLFSSRADMYRKMGFPDPINNAMMDARKAEIVGGFF